MKILVTGPTGFIGKHLIIKLLKEGHSIVAVEKPGSDVSFLTKNNIVFCHYNMEYKELFNFISQEKPDGVIHLASLVLVDHTSEQTGELVNTNILFPLHLIEASVNSNIKWFLNTGTFWQHYQDRDYSPVNLYAATKQAFEDLARYYFETTDINFVTFKLFDTFGPNDTRPKIFNLWMKCALSGDLLEMSQGEQIIDISHINNITDGVTVLMNLISKDTEKYFCGKTYAIKAEQRITLKELAKLFQQETGYTLNIAWGKKEYRPREVMIPWQYGEEIPGWKPKITLQEGIRLFLTHHKK